MSKLSTRKKELGADNLCWCVSDEHVLIATPVLRHTGEYSSVRVLRHPFKCITPHKSKWKIANPSVEELEGSGLLVQMLPILTAGKVVWFRCGSLLRWLNYSFLKIAIIFLLGGSEMHFWSTKWLVVFLWWGFLMNFCSSRIISLNWMSLLLEATQPFEFLFNSIYVKLENWV